MILTNNTIMIKPLFYKFITLLIFEQEENSFRIKFFIVWSSWMPNSSHFYYTVCPRLMSHSMEFPSRASSR
jgi:hypothetical protein